MKALILLSLVLTSLPSAHGQEEALYWDFSLVRVNARDFKVLPSDSVVELNLNDRFRLYFSFPVACWAGIFYEDSQGLIETVLLREVITGEKVVLPGENSSFVIRPPAGLEKFHIIVSREPLTQLKVTGQKPLSEALSALRRQASRLAEAPSRPIPMGGTTRGAINFNMTRYSGAPLYAKTIRIEH